MTSPRALPRRRWLRSVRVQGLALAAILIALPIVVFGILGRADTDRRQLIVNAVGETGDAVAAGLAAVLHDLRPSDTTTLRAALTRFTAPDRSIKVLLRPTIGTAPSAFYLMATEPQIPSEQTEAERQQLLGLGILPDLPKDCDAHFVRGRDASLLDNGAQVLTSVASVNGAAGCWVIVIATGEQQVLGAVEARPYWARPDVRLAILIYLLLALLIAAMFGGIWSDLLRFRRLALASPEQPGFAQPGFAQAADTPELAPVASAFDSMVQRMRRSAEMLRQAAEDNAHAFKGPIGTIRLAIETTLPARVTGDGLVPGALPAIAAALDRLDGLVRSARVLDSAAAELLEPAYERVDLSALVRGFVAHHAAMIVGAEVTVEAQVDDAIGVLGQTELLETILETLVDNAVSFAPVEGRVVVALTARGNEAVLTVADDGPGIAPERLKRVFERYYSYRPGGGTGQHFGVGLWLARQNAAAMGGRISAANRAEGGLCVTVVLPVAG
jgi:two-component system sensor histidine kinase ChvG